MDRTRSAQAVEDRIELFEIGKDLDEHRLGLLLELGRQLRAACAADTQQSAADAYGIRPGPRPDTASPYEGRT